MTLAKCEETSSTFELSWHEDVMIKGTDDCWDVPRTVRGSPVKRFGCHGQKGNQHFTLAWVRSVDVNPVMIKHVPSATCVEAEIATRRVYLAPCDDTVVSQHWHWDTVQWKRAKKHEKELHLEH